MKIIHNMLEKFIETKVGSFVTWLSGSTTLLSILHIVPIFCGAIAAVVWLIITIYRLRSAIYEMEMRKIELLKTINQICLKADCPTRVSASAHVDRHITPKQ